jgi:hypothetical protein
MVSLNSKKMLKSLSSQSQSFYTHLVFPYKFCNFFNNLEQTIRKQPRNCIEGIQHH